jgi:hypothetical protein
VVSDDVLAELRERLDAGLTPFERQQIARLLVRRISVETTVLGPRNKTVKVLVDYAFPCVVQSHTGSRCTLRPSRPSPRTTGSCVRSRRRGGTGDHPRFPPRRTCGPPSCTAPQGASPLIGSCLRSACASLLCWPSGEGVWVATPYMPLVGIEVNGMFPSSSSSTATSRTAPRLDRSAVARDIGDRGVTGALSPSPPPSLRSRRSGGRLHEPPSRANARRCSP